MWNRAQWASRNSRILRHRSGQVLALIAAAALTIMVAPPASAAAAPPKVAIIVGPAGSSTSTMRSLGNKAATEARRYTSDVVRVYSPNATWSRVRAAMTGASVVVYIGRGRGFPSPYSTTLRPSSQDGFGLNPTAGVNNTTTRFYGESYVRSVSLARNAVVLLSHVPYASGAGEPGGAPPTLSTARRRVDNYGSGFLAAGASAVIAERTSSPVYYIRAIFTKTQSLDSMWRSAPTRRGHVSSYASRRTPGTTVRTDPVYRTALYYRSIVGHLATSTKAVREAPPATTTPTIGGPVVYGPSINADSLNNSPIGGRDLRQASYRFRATTSSTLASIRIYLASGTGYSGGTGGAISISVQEDDGSGAHAPSGSTLASVTIHPGNPVAIGPLPLVSFPTPATLTVGRLYHIVFRNVDANPTANFVSVNGLFTFADLEPWQPAYTNLDWANLVKMGSGSWSDERGSGQGTISPIMALNYANGHVAGVGYMEVWVESPKVISGSRKAREVFTVSGSDRRITGVSVRVKRLSGSGPLRVRLETPGGDLIEEGSIPASRIPTTGYASWATYSFSTPRTLTTGHGYHLVLSSDSDSSYSVFVLREGSTYGFGPATYFADGTGQYDPGSGWVGFDQPGGATNLTQGDLQFAFR